MRRRGIEPLSHAWKARMITTTLSAPTDRPGTKSNNEPQRKEQVLHDNGSVTPSTQEEVLVTGKASEAAGKYKIPPGKHDP